MPPSFPLYFFFAALQIGQWRARQVRLRNLVALVPDRVTEVTRPTGLVDGWFVAAVAGTFLGGAALALSMFVAGARTYAWSWLGLLALGAICTGVVLCSTLREPVIAEDDGSLAADELLRRQAIATTIPAIYSVPAAFDLVGEGRPPHAFTGPILGYVALCLALQTGVAIAQRHRKLPPGHYGTTDSGTGETTPDTSDNVWRPADGG
ncbi:hypothetical protein SAMN04489732_103195 [Amycolatopsis saalfeldensis]|uniref:Uncharacterized protein n=2 Tax=Amycolatopsis saalfeldensis TaxID=394193 RepID=A0A1H8UD40_9PSEU|nr:hypothetical protein SAMN04489732_103195 [Amycolatopsis saalfeldensis]